jgi:hypothetical protein
MGRARAATRSPCSTLPVAPEHSVAQPEPDHPISDHSEPPGSLAVMIASSGIAVFPHLCRTSLSPTSSLNRVFWEYEIHHLHYISR